MGKKATREAPYGEVGVVAGGEVEETLNPWTQAPSGEVVGVGDGGEVEGAITPWTRAPRGEVGAGDGGKIKGPITPWTSPGLVSYAAWG